MAANNSVPRWAGPRADASSSISGENPFVGASQRPSCPAPAVGGGDGGVLSVLTRDSVPDGPVGGDCRLVLAAVYGGTTAAFSATIARQEVEKLVKGHGVIVFPHAEAKIVKGVWLFNAVGRHIAALALADRYTEETPANRRGWSIWVKECSTVPSPASDLAIGTPRKTVSDDGGKQLISPTGRTACYFDEHGNEVPTSGPRHLPRAHPGPVPRPRAAHQHNFAVQAHHTPAVAGPPSHHGSASHSSEIQLHPTNGSTGQEPQNIILDRIRQGIDVRTTVMVRNIPTDMTLREFLSILNATSRGRFDFSYLRFDFSKGTNVGYAFINFIGPMEIANWMEEREGNPWRPATDFNTAGPVKLVETAYATTQGLECCIEKFRNSSVMDEIANYRPKLWYTVDTALYPHLIGTERKFPPPNNHAKHKRSCDNASQIGLYAPTPYGRHARGRGQRSQFDRGTRAQLREEAYLNQFSPPRGYGYQFHQDGSAPMVMPPQFPSYYGHGSFANTSNYGYGHMPYIPGVGVAGPSNIASSVGQMPVNHGLYDIQEAGDYYNENAFYHQL